MKKEQHMKSNMHIVLTALTISLITVLAAYCEEVQYKVNRKTIPCKVTDPQTGSLGIWNNFNFKYEFCNGNRFTLQRGVVQYKINNDEKVTYVHGPEPVGQACNSAAFMFYNDPKLTDYLRYATIDEQVDVCNERFKLTNITLEPLK